MRPLWSEHGAELLLVHGDGASRARPARRHDAVHRERVAAGAGRRRRRASRAPRTSAAARRRAAAAAAQVAREVHAHREDHERDGRRHDEDVRRLARVGRRSSAQRLLLGRLGQERQDLHAYRQPNTTQLVLCIYSVCGWLGSRVVSVLNSGAEGPGFKSPSRRCRGTVLSKLFTLIVPLFTKQRNW